MAEPAGAPASAPAPAAAVQPADRPYPQLQRTPGLPPWRPLVSIVFGAAVSVAVIFHVGIVSALFLAVAGGDSDGSALETGPGGFVFTNLLLAGAIPVSLAAVAVGFGRLPWGLSSVTGRLRRGWLVRAALVAAVWAVLLSLLWLVLDGPPDTGGEHALPLIVICLLTTPFQAAGEEYLIRGWLTQSIGAWFARPVAGAVVAALVSATVFALLHGQQDPWLFSDRFAFGLIASWLVWRTGGLEAGIALHALSNVAAIVPSALEGTLDESLVVSEAPAGEVLIDIAGLVVAALALAWLARRGRLRRAGTLPEG